MRPDYRFPPKPIDNPDHISILMPTRGRPEKLGKVFNNFQEMIENKHSVDVWLYVDDDDEITLQYIRSDEWKKYGIKINWYIGKSTKSMGDMLNQLWQRCTTNPGIYFPFCDDYTIETPKWDVILRDFISRYEDGILLAYPIDPLHAAYQVTIPIPSARWLNILGYFATNRFFFWFDDVWLDRIADMAQRKLLVPIRIIAQGGKGSTPRMRNLPFWNRYFACTLDDRFADAVKLLEAIHQNDLLSLKLAQQNARERAAIQLHKSGFGEPVSERVTEFMLRDPEHVPGVAQLLNYLETELYAVEDLLLKVNNAFNRNNLSDVLFLLNALELSSYNISEIDYIKAKLFQDSGYSYSAAESLLKHIENNPEDIKSAPLYNIITNNLTTHSFNGVSPYLSAWLGIEDDYYIYFPSKIDEELYFIIQGIVYLSGYKCEKIDSFLIVGSGKSDEAVQAIVSAHQNASPNMLFCIEPNEDTYLELEKKYSHVATSYNCSSVTMDNYISESELAAFYKHIPSVMNKYSLESFTLALRREKQFLASRDCIKNIKRTHNLDRFDLVILDGSLFSGEADLDAVYGANTILLISINSVKNYANHKKLLEDANYRLLFSKPELAGYSMFRWRTD